MRTDDEINRAVAMELGWRPHTSSDDHWKKPGSYENILLSFCTDHNAVAEMRKVIHRNHHQLFIDHLDEVLGILTYTMLPEWMLMNSTPRQQAEAFLRMRGKWVEEEKV